MIWKKYIFSVASILTIQWVCFQSATKSFRPVWEGRRLAQKCKDRWLDAMLKKVTKT